MQRPGLRDFRGQKLSKDTRRSVMDPRAKLYRKGRGKEAKLSHLTHDLVHAERGVIPARCVTETRSSAERGAALRMSVEVAERDPGLLACATLLGDKNHCVAGFLAKVQSRGLEPWVPVRSDRGRKEVPTHEPAARDGWRAVSREEKRECAEAVHALLDSAPTPA